MSLVQFNGQQDTIIQKVWYAGTKTLLEGMPLYFDLDDTNAPVVDSWDPSPDPGPSSINPTSNRNLRGYRVIDVNSTNVAMLAGVVANNSAGLVGPCFVDIIRPIKGTVCNIQVSYNSAAKGDLVKPDESTPSNTFVLEAAAGAATSVTTTILANTVFQVMQTGPGSASASSPAMVLARAL